MKVNVAGGGIAGYPGAANLDRYEDKAWSKRQRLQVCPVSNGTNFGA
jgi:hypothetical protein